MDHTVWYLIVRSKNIKKVPSDRRGRACKLKLVPSSNSSVLGDRIDIMSNAVGANNQFKTNVAYLDGNNEVGFQIEIRILIPFLSSIKQYQFENFF